MKSKVLVGTLSGLALVVAMAVGRWAPTVIAGGQQTPKPVLTDGLAHNFGGAINTQWDEGEFAFASDGTMVMTSSRQDLAVAPGDPKDLYIAAFNAKTGTWDPPVNMGLPINAAPATSVDPLRKGDDREPWISPDGNTIYFKSDRLATSSPKNNNDIFVTHKVNGKWTTPELVPAPISTDVGDEHCPMLLRDGKTLCFASQRPGGLGGFDIWCSQQAANGKWQDPVNQGPNINSEASEFHFTQDRTTGTVYFTSSRAGGLGSSDLYAAPSTGNNTWGPAVNLGPQVNTPGMDMCPALTPDGKGFGWFSSARGDSRGMSDIYFMDKSKVDSVLPPRK